MNDEKQTPKNDNFDAIPPIETTDGGIISGRRPEARDFPSPDGIAQELGGSAVSLGEISDNPIHRIPERTLDDSSADLDSRTWPILRIEREDLVRIPGPDGEVQYRILEPTDGMAPNGGRTVFDWIISRHPSAVFAKEDNGYRGYRDPSVKSESKHAET